MRTIVVAAALLAGPLGVYASSQTPSSVPSINSNQAANATSTSIQISSADATPSFRTF